MIIAHHLLFTNYGYWLPNDPRGSLSKEIHIPEIAELGEHHYGRKKQQPTSAELTDFHNRAEKVLKHPVIRFNAEQINIIARGFATTIEQNKYTCYACAIMPDHVHIIIRKHRHHAEEMLDNLQNTSREHLIAPHDSSFIKPDSSFSNNHPIWTRPGYKVFIDTLADMHRTIKYVEDNPTKIKRPAQHFDFVTPYNNWLPGRHPERK